MKMPEMKKKSSNTSRKTQFLKLSPGTHVVRILPPEFYLTFTHWLVKERINVECPGEDVCPICLRNKEIIDMNPNSFRDNPKYSYRREVFYANVLDKTPAVVCPSCGEIHKKVGTSFPSTCVNCSEFINSTEPAPLNKVRLLNRGSELYGYLLAINNSIVDGNNEPIGLENFDVMLLVPPETKRPIAQGLINNNEPVNVPEDALYDLKTASLQLEPEEIGFILEGVSLKDVFQARKVEEKAGMESPENTSKKKELDELKKDTSESMRNKFKDLFS